MTTCWRSDFHCQQDNIIEPARKVLNCSSSVFAQQHNGKILTVFAYPQPNQLSWPCFSLDIRSVSKVLSCTDLATLCGKGTCFRLPACAYVEDEKTIEAESQPLGPGTVEAMGEINSRQEQK